MSHFGLPLAVHDGHDEQICRRAGGLGSKHWAAAAGGGTGERPHLPPGGASRPACSPTSQSQCSSKSTIAECNKMGELRQQEAASRSRSMTLGGDGGGGEQARRQPLCSLCRRPQAPSAACFSMPPALPCPEQCCRCKAVRRSTYKAKECRHGGHTALVLNIWCRSRQENYTHGR